MRTRSQNSIGLMLWAIGLSALVGLASFAQEARAACEDEEAAFQAAMAQANQAAANFQAATDAFNAAVAANRGPGVAAGGATTGWAGYIAAAGSPAAAALGAAKSAWDSAKKANDKAQADASAAFAALLRCREAAEAEVTHEEFRKEETLIRGPAPLELKTFELPGPPSTGPGVSTGGGYYPPESPGEGEKESGYGPPSLPGYPTPPTAPGAPQKPTSGGVKQDKGYPTYSPPTSPYLGGSADHPKQGSGTTTPQAPSTGGGQTTGTYNK